MPYEYLTCANSTVYIYKITRTTIIIVLVQEVLNVYNLLSLVLNQGNSDLNVVGKAGGIGLLRKVK